jgi:hypothetical protein
MPGLFNEFGEGKRIIGLETSTPHLGDNQLVDLVRGYALLETVPLETGNYFHLYAKGLNPGDTQVRDFRYFCLKTFSFLDRTVVSDGPKRVGAPTSDVTLPETNKPKSRPAEDNF